MELVSRPSKQSDAHRQLDHQTLSGLWACFPHGKRAMVRPREDLQWRKLGHPMRMPHLDMNRSLPRCPKPNATERNPRRLARSRARRASPDTWDGMRNRYLLTVPRSKTEKWPLLQSDHSDGFRKMHTSPGSDKSEAPPNYNGSGRI